jgi:hypothetical protein
VIRGPGAMRKLLVGRAAAFPTKGSKIAVYSCRKANIGSTRDACLAGRYPASAAVADRINVAPPIAIGSDPVMPNS